MRTNSFLIFITIVLANSTLGAAVLDNVSEDFFVRAVGEEVRVIGHQTNQLGQITNSVLFIVSDDVIETNQVSFEFPDIVPPAKSKWDLWQDGLIYPNWEETMTSGEGGVPQVFRRHILRVDLFNNEIDWAHFSESIGAIRSIHPTSSGGVFLLGSTGYERLSSNGLVSDAGAWPTDSQIAPVILGEGPNPKFLLWEGAETPLGIFTKNIITGQFETNVVFSVEESFLTNVNRIGAARILGEKSELALGGEDRGSDRGYIAWFDLESGTLLRQALVDWGDFGYDDVDVEEEFFDESGNYYIALGFNKGHSVHLKKISPSGMQVWQNEFVDGSRLDGPYLEYDAAAVAADGRLILTLVNLFGGRNSSSYSKNLLYEISPSGHVTGPSVRVEDDRVFPSSGSALPDRRLLIGESISSEAIYATNRLMVVPLGRLEASFHSSQLIEDGVLGSGGWSFGIIDVFGVRSTNLVFSAISETLGIYQLRDVSDWQWLTLNNGKYIWETPPFTESPFVRGMNSPKPTQIQLNLSNTNWTTSLQWQCDQDGDYKVSGFLFDDANGLELFPGEQLAIEILKNGTNLYSTNLISDFKYRQVPIFLTEYLSAGDILDFQFSYVTPWESFTMSVDITIDRVSAVPVLDIESNGVVSVFEAGTDVVFQISTNSFFDEISESLSVAIDDVDRLFSYENGEIRVSGIEEGVHFVQISITDQFGYSRRTELFEFRMASSDSFEIVLSEEEFRDALYLARAIQQTDAIEDPYERQFVESFFILTAEMFDRFPELNSDFYELWFEAFGEEIDIIRASENPSVIPSVNGFSLASLREIAEGLQKVGTTILTTVICKKPGSSDACGLIVGTTLNGWTDYFQDEAYDDLFPQRREFSVDEFTTRKPTPNQAYLDGLKRVRRETKEIPVLEDSLKNVTEPRYDYGPVDDVGEELEEMRKALPGQIETASDRVIDTLKKAYDENTEEFKLSMSELSALVGESMAGINSALAEQKGYLQEILKNQGEVLQYVQDERRKEEIEKKAQEAIEKFQNEIRTMGAGVTLLSYIGSAVDRELGDNIAAVGGGSIEIYKLMSLTDFSDLDFGSTIEFSANLFSIVGNIINAIFGGKSNDEKILEAVEEVYNQAVELRRELREVAIVLNDRLDAIDKRLILIYDDLGTRMANINFDIGVLQQDVEGIQSTLDQASEVLLSLQTRLNIVAEVQLLQSFRANQEEIKAYHPFDGLLLTDEKFNSFASVFAQFGITESISEVAAPVEGRFISDGQIADELQKGSLDKNVAYILSLLQSKGFLTNSVSSFAGMPNASVWHAAADEYLKLAELWPVLHRRNVVSDSRLSYLIQRGEQLAGLTTSLVVVGSGFESVANEHLWSSLFSNYRQKVQSFLARMPVDEAKFKREVVVNGDFTRFAAIEAFDLFTENQFVSYRPQRLNQDQIEGRSLTGNGTENGRELTPMENAGKLLNNDAAAIELLSFGKFDVSFSNLGGQNFEWPEPCDPGGETSYSSTLSLYINGYFQPSPGAILVNSILGDLTDIRLFSWHYSEPAPTFSSGVVINDPGPGLGLYYCPLQMLLTSWDQMLTNRFDPGRRGNTDFFQRSTASSDETTHSYIKETALRHWQSEFYRHLADEARTGGTDLQQLLSELDGSRALLERVIRLAFPTSRFEDNELRFALDGALRVVDTAEFLNLLVEGENMAVHSIGVGNNRLDFSQMLNSRIDNLEAIISSLLGNIVATGEVEEVFAIRSMLNRLETERGTVLTEQPEPVFVQIENTLNFMVLAEENTRLFVDVSTNLIDWVEIGTSVLPRSVVNDSGFNGSNLFYRAGVED